MDLCIQRVVKTKKNFAGWAKQTYSEFASHLHEILDEKKPVVCPTPIISVADT